MKILTAAHTDPGKKKINQDALSLQILSTRRGKAVMALVCDGLGGLKLGEEASGRVARALTEWFQTEFCELVWGGFTYRSFQREILRILRSEHRRIAVFGKKRRLLLGTTVSLLLLYQSHYYTVHVGDTRIYRFRGKGRRLTEDHMAGENVLFQCIGSSRSMKPDFGRGLFFPGDIFLLCSDGFYRRINIQEMARCLRAGELKTEKSMYAKLLELSALSGQRGEDDNRSACLVRVLGSI